MDVRRQRHWGRALVGGVASGDPSWLGSGGGWLVVLPARSGREGALGPCWQGGATTGILVFP